MPANQTATSIASRDTRGNANTLVVATTAGSTEGGRGDPPLPGVGEVTRLVGETALAVGAEVFELKPGVSDWLAAALGADVADRVAAVGSTAGSTAERTTRSGIIVSTSGTSLRATRTRIAARDDLSISGLPSQEVPTAIRGSSNELPMATDSDNRCRARIQEAHDIAPSRLPKYLTNSCARP